MSQTQLPYMMNTIISLIDGILKQAGVYSRDPNLYATIMQNVSTLNTPLQNDLIATLDNGTRGEWRRTTINAVDLEQKIIRPWLRAVVASTEQQLYGQRYAQQSPPAWGAPAPQAPYYAAPPPYQPTSSLYAIGSEQRPVSPVTQQPSQIVVPMSSSFNLGRRVVVDIRHTSMSDLRITDGGLLILSDLKTGNFEDEPAESIRVLLNIAENNAIKAALRVFKVIPKETIRGYYAHVITYKKLIHVPMGISPFTTIANEIGDVFFKKNHDWRAALDSLDKKTRSEWNLFSDIICSRLNASIYRRIRTTDGAKIDGIETIDDIRELDNRSSTLKPTRHSNYDLTLDSIVKKAFIDVFDPSHVVRIEDSNFGDFVNCDGVDYYRDGRSKYDYGTFQEKIDRAKFIGEMTQNDTVLRIPTAIILTNAVDMKLIDKVRHDGSLLFKDVQTLGSSFLETLDVIPKTDIETVICTTKESTPEKFRQTVNVGTTMDGDLIFLRD